MADPPLHHADDLGLGVGDGAEVAEENLGVQRGDKTRANSSSWLLLTSSRVASASPRLISSILTRSVIASAAKRAPSLNSRWLKNWAPMTSPRISLTRDSPPRRVHQRAGRRRGARVPREHDGPRGATARRCRVFGLPRAVRVARRPRGRGRGVRVRKGCRPRGMGGHPRRVHAAGGAPGGAPPPGRWWRRKPDVRRKCGSTATTT